MPRYQTGGGMFDASTFRAPSSPTAAIRVTDEYLARPRGPRLEVPDEEPSSNAGVLDPQPGKLVEEPVMVTDNAERMKRECDAGCGRQLRSSSPSTTCSRCRLRGLRGRSNEATAAGVPELKHLEEGEGGGESSASETAPAPGVENDSPLPLGAMTDERLGELLDSIAAEIQRRTDVARERLDQLGRLRSRLAVAAG